MLSNLMSKGQDWGNSKVTDRRYLWVNLALAVVTVTLGVVGGLGGVYLFG